KAALRALGEIGPEAKDSAPILIEALNDKDAEVVKAAEFALTKVPASIKPAIPLLIPLLKPDGRYAYLAAITLADIGSAYAETSEAVAPLGEVLKDKSPDVRMAAAKALGSIGPASKPAFPQLLKVYQADPDPNVKKTAAAALVSIDQAEAT